MSPHPDPAPGRLAVTPDTPLDQVVQAVREWVAQAVPEEWVEAGRRGGPSAVREVRTRAAYEAWYPVFGRSGLVVPTWPVAYGGLDLAADAARRIDQELAPFNLGRLNPLGLNLAAPALMGHGTEDQRRRFLPPIVANHEVWCQLFSEPGAGSDLASLATRAEPDGDQWLVTGQKVWTTWAHRSDWAVLLARTDADVAKRRGLTYFLIDLHQPGVDIRPLRHMGGDAEFNQVFLDRARVPDGQRVGPVGQGWTVANATLSGERQMVSGSGSGGVDRIGGSGVGHLIRLAGHAGRAGAGAHPLGRQRIAGLLAEERIREWTNLRVRMARGAGRPAGPESSVGKVHQGELNQRIQLAATDALGPAATAWAADPDGPADYASGLPHEVRGMLRSRANTIEGGTSEVLRNQMAERILGLPRDFEADKGVAWAQVTRN